MISGVGSVSQLREMPMSKNGRYTIAHPPNGPCRQTDNAGADHCYVEPRGDRYRGLRT